MYILSHSLALESACGKFRVAWSIFKSMHAVADYIRCQYHGIT